MHRVVEYLILFIFLVLLQTMLFDNIEFGGVISISIYPLFILLLPANISGWLLLLLCAATGAVIDISSGMGGVNTISILLLGFLRPLALNVFVGRDSVEDGVIPSPARIGTVKFVFYTLSLMVVYCSLLSFLEVLSFENLLYLLIRIVVSIVFSELFIFIASFPLFGKKIHTNNRI